MPLSHERPPPLAPLERDQVPRISPSDVVDQDAAIRLGKAFFWDVQVGSDGQVACASCHFARGVDNRLVNTVHPGPNGIFELVDGPGETFDGRSWTTSPDDVVGSQGVARADFESISSDPSDPADVCAPRTDPIFGSDRQVTDRQAPSVIGAIFNEDNLWDGRADNIFNGVDPFGTDGAGTRSHRNASVASQAVAPPMSDVEMICTGRAFVGTNSLADKLLDRRPLAFQVVAHNDSVLGPYSRGHRGGIRCPPLGTGRPGHGCTYRDMIELAFGADSVLASDPKRHFTVIWARPSRNTWRPSCRIRHRSTPF